VTATAPLFLEDLRFAWANAGLCWTVSESQRGHVKLVVAQEQREGAFDLTVSSLRTAGWRACADRHNLTWSVFGFSDAEAIRIDLLDGSQRQSASVRSLIGRVPPCVALAGPDGVGKSTALNASREWFHSRAPFVETFTRQWRPALLPPLAWFLGRGSDTAADTKPRRERGNLQILRLSYYFFDYLLGSWWKDRNRSDRSRLVLYDRSAIDMTVDPYRYGLASCRGTQLIWKLTPRPQTLILLYDNPARIYGRKGDLDENETADQMYTWLKLAAQDRLHALIRADAGPEEVACCTRDLLVDAFIGHYEHGFRSSAWNALHNIREILEFSPEGNSEEYAILPSSRNPRFLLPIQNWKRAAVGLGIYNAQRPFARLSKRLLTAALHGGIARPFLRDRISINSQLLKETLHPVFGGDQNISFAISIGTPGPNQKPVLQIANPLGLELGYAKMGWNRQTVGAVRREETALRRLESIRFMDASVPKVLYAGWLGKRYLLVQSPCGTPGPAGAKLTSKHVQFLVELHQIAPSFGRLPFPQKSQIAGLRKGGYHYYAHVLEGAREYCNRFETAPLGPLHGDFTAWNIRQDLGRLAVVDWECFRESAPAAWDLFHFIVAAGVEIDDYLPGRIYADITGSGETSDLVQDYFRFIGADPHLINPLLASYAAESLVQSLTELQENAGANDRQLRRTWAMLLALIGCRKECVAGQVSRVEVTAAQ
jgi:hypothetical protein